MPLSIQVGDYDLTGETAIHKLIAYGLLPQFTREIFIDCSIADIPYTEAELEQALTPIREQYGLAEPDSLDRWLDSLNYAKNDFFMDITRTKRVQRFKEDKWGTEVPTLFLQRKQELDRAVYSIIRLKDIGVAQELYFRLQAGEQTFKEIATKYSMGPEASTGGLIGPVELGKLHPSIANLLKKGSIGELFPPQVIDQWVVIVRIEQFTPAQLDQTTRDRLINEAFQAWLQSQPSQGVFRK